MFDDADINNRDRLGVRLEHENGQAVIVYTTNKDDAALQFSMSVNSVGELSIPSALGAALQVEDQTVTWTRRETPDGHFEFRARTNSHLPLVDTSQSDGLEAKPLKHVSQDVEYKGDNWESEHFQLYLTIKSVNMLNWPKGSSVGIKLIRVNNIPTIMVTPNTQGFSQKSIKTVDTTGELQKDRLMYVPNDIVRSLELVESDLKWVAIESDLILVPV
jgi:hypothetical protein